MKKLSGILILLALIGLGHGQKIDIHEKNVREMKNPFRMAKVNIIWEKARQVCNF